MKQENVHQPKGFMNPKYLQGLVDFGQKKNINSNLPYIFFAKKEFSFFPRKKKVSLSLTKLERNFKPTGRKRKIYSSNEMFPSFEFRS